MRGHPVTVVGGRSDVDPGGVATMTCSACDASTSGPAGPTEEATRQRLWWEQHRCPDPSSQWQAELW